MRRQLMTLAWAAAAMAVVTMVTSDPASAQRRGRNTFAAVPGVKGGQELFGPYEVDPNWPQNVSELPGHEAWTWGAGQSVFAVIPGTVNNGCKSPLSKTSGAGNHSVPVAPPSMSKKDRAP